MSDKKAQVIEFAGVGILLVLVVIGAISSTNILSEHRYIGDNSTNQTYDLSKCFIEISKENIVYFDSLEESENVGYNLVKCN